MNIKKHNETIIGFLGNLIPIILIAMVLRMYIKSLGFDNFTANTFFIVIIILGVFIYMIFMNICENLFPKIERLFYKRIKEQNNKYKEDSINDIRKHISESKIIEEEGLKIAIEYTKEKFSKYVSVTDLEKLCTYIEFYYKQENLDEVKAIAVKSLKTIDICHFSWNIYNHFNKLTNRKELVLFFKPIFPKILESGDLDYYAKNLTRSPGKGLIKIQHDLLDDESQTID